MRRMVVSALLAVALATASGAAAWAQDSSENAASALIELGQRVYYAGEPFNVRVSVASNRDETIDNPVKTPLFKGFEVRHVDGGTISRTGKSQFPEAQRPGKLGPRGFYGSVVDLTTMYPELLSTGHYEIRWSADGVSSNTLQVRMIPRYEPAKDYRAVIDTHQGEIVIDFLNDVSPISVKNFVDLARADFYNGLTFHEVRRDRFIVGGDPTGTGAGGAGYTYPAEMSATPAMAGTVLMKPVSPTPPANSSQFIILLRREPAWTGQMTVVGQVIRGLDVVQKISKVPTGGEPSRPSFRPLEDVRIKSITITERGEGQPAG